MQLMQKFSKKLVSKVVYVKILRSSSSELLECFLNEKGWELLNTWFSEAIRTSNWPLCTELLQLFALCPISAHRLKENADQNQAPKLVRQLSLDARVDSGVRHLSSQLFNSWMSIVSQQQSTVAPVRSARLTRSVIVPNNTVQTQLVTGQPRVLVAVHTSTEEIINMTNMTVANSGMMNHAHNMTTISAVRPTTNTHIMSSAPYDVIMPVSGAPLQYNQQSSQNDIFGVIRNECLEDAMDIDDLVDRTLSNNAPSVVNNEGAGVSILQGMADELSETLKKEVQDEVKKEKLLLKKKEELKSKEKLKEKSSDRRKSDKERSRDKDRNKDKDRDKRHNDERERRREKERQREREKKEKKRESKPFRETEMRDGVDTAEKQRIKELAEKMRKEVKALPKIPKVPKKSEAPKDVASNISTNKPSFDDLMSAIENPTTKTVKAAPIKNKNRDLLASFSDTASKPKPKPKEVKKISRTDFLLKDRGPTEDKSKAIIKEKEPEKKEEPKVETKNDEEKKSVKRPAPEEESKLKVKSPSQLVDSPMFGDFLSTIIPEVPKKKKIKFSDLKAQKEAKTESSKDEDSEKSIKPAAFSFYGEGNVAAEENSSDENPGSPVENSNEIIDSEMKDEKPVVEEYSGPREVSGILVINKGAKQTRRIQWRPETQLVEVEYFEVEEGERVNVNKLKFEEQRKKELEFEKLRMKNRNDNFEMDDRPWPELTSMQLSCEMPEIEYGGNSKEKKEQQLRETSTLQALFFNKNPTDPLEPDSGLSSRMECKPIPLEDASGEEEEIKDYTNEGWPEPIYDSFMSSPPSQPQAPTAAGMAPTATNILQNLIGGSQLLGGNQQAMDDALFAAQKAAAETLLKQGLLPPVFMDQNVPPGHDDQDNMMDYDEMPPNMNQPPPGMGWRGGPGGPQHHHRQGPMQGPPPFRRGGNGPMNRMNNMGGHHNDFNRGGGFGGRGMPQRGHFPPRGGYQNRPPNFNDRPNFGNNHGNMNSGRGRRPCKYWMESGSCRQEDRCGFLHPGHGHR